MLLRSRFFGLFGGVFRCSCLSGQAICRCMGCWRSRDRIVDILLSSGTFPSPFRSSRGFLVLSSLRFFQFLIGFSSFETTKPQYIETQYLSVLCMGEHRHKNQPYKSRKMVGRGGFELPTFRLSVERSSRAELPAPTFWCD